jgi:hypothetical protein
MRDTDFKKRKIGQSINDEYDMRFPGTHWTSMFILFVCSSWLGVAQELRDVITPVKVAIGRPDTILVSDLFFATNYAVAFAAHPQMNISYDPTRNTVVILPATGFSGATTVGFTLGGVPYDLPVIVQNARDVRSMHTFTYRPEKKVDRVAVSGSFNNWNKSDDVLEDVHSTGIYSLTIPLEPGSYIYQPDSMTLILFFASRIPTPPGTSCTSADDAKRRTRWNSRLSMNMLEAAQDSNHARLLLFSTTRESRTKRFG